MKNEMGLQPLMTSIVIRSLSHSNSVGCLLGVIFQHRGEKTPFSNQRVEDVDFLDIDLDGGITNDGPANGLLPQTTEEHGHPEAFNYTGVAGDMGNPFDQLPGLPPTLPNRLIPGNGLLPQTTQGHGHPGAFDHTAVAGDMDNLFGRPPGLPPTPPNRLVTGDSKQN